MSEECACRSGFYSTVGEDDVQVGFEAEDGEMLMAVREKRGDKVREIWLRGVKYCPLCGREL